VSATIPPFGTPLKTWQAFTATGANYFILNGRNIGSYEAVLISVQPTTRETWFNAYTSTAPAAATIQQYVPLNATFTFVLPTLSALMSLYAINSQNGDEIYARVVPVVVRPGCYPYDSTPLIYQWPTASIAAGDSAIFDLSAPYYGQASLTVLNTTNTNCYAALVQYDTSLTQVGVSLFSPMNGITATGYSAINQQVYIPPGRTRLQITNLGAVGTFFYASLTANPKTLAVS
jgi:hypothetical protein